MDISVVNLRAIFKELYPKVMELLDFKIVLVKSLIGTYKSQREENVDTVMLEGLKTKHTFNVIHMDSFLCPISGNRSRNCFAHFHSGV